MSESDKTKVEVAVHDQSTVLGEGPLWNPQSKTLHWVDIMGDAFHVLDVETGTDIKFDVPSHLGFAVLDTKGQVIAGVKEGIARFGLDVANRKITNYEVIHRPKEITENIRFNDGKVDPYGRLWGGTMDMKEEKPLGYLYMLDTDNTLHLKESGYTVANGMAWSPDHKTFYHIDSPVRTVWAHDYEAKNGNITNKRVAIKLPESFGYPDGMTIDTDGMLWIACWDGSRVTQWNPNTAKLLRQVDFPVSRTSSCCFGGENLDIMFVTSAKKDLTPEQIKEQKNLPGAVFRVTGLGVKGFVEKPYGAPSN